jgi:hypothetical protein
MLSACLLCAWRRRHVLHKASVVSCSVRGGRQATLDEQTLRERYLPPWKAIADQGMLRGVMISQSAVNHIPMVMHARLITGE